MSSKLAISAVGRGWTLALVAILSGVTAEAATAGGTAVLAPADLRPAKCRQGAPAKYIGVGASPISPTVVGCADVAELGPALVAVQRWDSGVNPQICFFVAPESEVDVDGVCTSTRSRRGPVHNALTGVRGVFPARLRKVGGDGLKQRPDIPIVSGIASTDVEWVDLEYFSRKGSIERERASEVRVEPSLADRLGAEGSFDLFAVRFPAEAHPCRRITISWPDGQTGRWERAPVARFGSGLPGPGSEACAKKTQTGDDFLSRVMRVLSPFSDARPVLEKRGHEDDGSFLAFSQTPRNSPGPISNLMGRRGLAGRSSQGRKIFLRQWGDPAVGGELLVFSCIHGDECAAREIQPIAGCPSPDADIYRVNLNPDGLAEGTRLNGRGVDLNRNFPDDWKPIGIRGGAQYSGPRPFSEPETRLAARIIRRLDPETTIWFHQHAGPAFVRAWGQSVSAARRYARLARLPFRRLPWLAGTAPNWQNNTFPGTSSFVVELPDGPLAPRRLSGLGLAANKLAREQADLP